MQKLKKNCKKQKKRIISLIYNTETEETYLYVCKYQMISGRAAHTD